MPAAERSVIAESLFDLKPGFKLARFSSGALIAAPAPPARGSKRYQPLHPPQHYLEKKSLDDATQRRPLYVAATALGIKFERTFGRSAPKGSWVNNRQSGTM